ncbi:MAG: DUF4349 domain-containing protein [Chloroflexota bacterium]
MRTIRSTAAVIAIVLLVAVLAACGGGASAPILATVGNALPAASAAADAGTGQGARASAAPAPADGVGAAVDDAKIIRTGTIDLEVRDVPVALRTARDGIRTLGGYVGASNTSNSDDGHPIATITYRIPAVRWEEALDLLRGLNGQTTKVVSEQTEAVEVTGQVIDIQARIQNLRASETALQAIARTAVKVSDVLEVQAQLTSVRGEIEVLTGQLKGLTDRAAFATLTANFGVPVVAVELAKKGWDPAVTMDEAAASLIDVVQALANAGIWFGIVWLPILVVLGLIVGIAAWVLRRIGVIGQRDRGSVTPTA